MAPDKNSDLFPPAREDGEEPQLGFDFPEEDIGAEAPASPEDDVAAFVDNELGLEVLSAFGKKSVGRKPSKPPLHFEPTRELTLEDAMAMQASPARAVGEAGGAPALQSLRTIHHQIARMMATGEKLVNISRILGVTPARLQQLKNDPTFNELQAHYEELEEQAEISIKHRFYLLGTTGMEELQERLLEAPDSFGNAHLLELVKLSVGGEAPKTSPAKGGGRSLAPEELDNLKRLADNNSRGRVEYRTEQSPAEERSNGETEKN